MTSPFAQPRLKDTIFSDNDPDYDPAKASPQVRQAVAAAERAAKKTHEETANALGLSELSKPTDLRTVKAKYKIELTFESKRTTQGPNRVGISLWESGKLFNGGGDESMFFCKDGTQENGQGCWAPIPNSQVKQGVAYCLSCKKAINADRLTLQKRGNIRTKLLCHELVKIFHQLGSNAELYVKFHKDDPHYVSMLRARGASVAERLKGLHIYPLKNILRDTAAGANLADRFFAFLTS